MTIRLLVTGANGFLGSAIVRKAINKGLLVKATDRFEKSIFDSVVYISADILQPSSLSAAIQNADVIIHAAGLAHIFNYPSTKEARFEEINVNGTRNVAYMAAGLGIKHFVLISSVSVYGNVSHGMNETAICHPEGAYAESKLQAERCLIDICEKKDMNLTILRLATLYGEEDPGNVARLIRAIDRGHFMWVGCGENLKSLLHRDDAARACVAAIETSMSGINIFNVSAAPIRMRDIVETIALALGRACPSLHIPAYFALNFAKVIKYASLNRGRLSTIYATLQKWLADDYYNSDKFCKTFNFQARVSLEEGIKREVEWYKAVLSR